MSITNLYRWTLFVGKHPEIFFQKKLFLFVISHMRSRSSLLSHILGSHPEITGYIEMHQSYRNRWDLLALLRKLIIYINNGKRLEGTFALDKILHNHHFFDEKILSMKKVKVIFLLRNPEETLMSLVKMPLFFDADFCEDKWQKPVKYYSDRLKIIAKYSEVIKGKGLFIDSQKIINETNSVLRVISNYLELEKELSPQYSVFEYTGKPGLGDTSKNIMSGKVMKAKHAHKDIIIPDAIRRVGTESYMNCRAKLIDNCVTL